MSAAGIAAVNTVVATDTDLVTAVRDGEDAAFEELYRRYYPRIAAFVRGYLHDGGRAEDVTQEAFMSALRRLRQTDSDINFKPWIFEIARNAAIDQFRRNGRADDQSDPHRSAMFIGLRQPLRHQPIPGHREVYARARDRHRR